MKLNRKIFYEHVRLSKFKGGLTQEQVDGIESLLDEWESLKPSDDIRWLAYILAGVYHETGGRMVPVREGFAETDQEARTAVYNLYNAGRIETNYAIPVKGVSYYGRGRIQNTWHKNYKTLEKRFGLPFVSNPDLLLDDKIDAKVTIIGHIEGLWTGKKLSDYFSATREDPINARRIVNGLDKATLIDDYYKDFREALVAAAKAPPLPEPVEPEPVEPDVPVKPVPKPVEPIPQPPAPIPYPKREGPVWVSYVLLAQYFGDPEPSKEVPMVAGAVAGYAASRVGRIVVDVVADAVQRAAQKDNPLQPQDALIVANDTAAEVQRDPRMREIIAYAEHNTNNEPNAKSRVIQGLSVTGIASFIPPAVEFAKSMGFDTPLETEQVITILTFLTQIGGVAWAWYGRTKARKPIGE